ncbi:MAG: nucleotide sugar dehydrogenase [Bacteroidota bacterium]
MRISVFGLGYVGSVSAVCLSELGHEVYGVDIIESKVEGLKQGLAPVKEPQLEPLLRKNLDSGRLQFRTDSEEVIAHSDVAMITVGTPNYPDGGINLTAVERCIQSIAEILAAQERESFLFIIRSTVPPGTTQRMQALAERVIAERATRPDFHCRLAFSMNPEFTREGAAVHDFFHPATIVFGLDEPAIQPRLAEVYRGIEAKEFWVPTPSAELIKYTNNAFHALKVAFANEIGRISDHYDVDGKAVMEILCADEKLNISTKYLIPGFAFGGSCLPKDLRGIHAIAEAKGVKTPLLDSVLPSNVDHIRHLQQRILADQPQRIGVLGIAFKADTDDVRESPGLKLICSLVRAGLDVKMMDVNLTPRFMMGRNKKYIDDLLPNWQTHFLEDEQAFFEQVDTVVITTTESIYQEWVAQYGADKTVHDLN